MGIRDCAKKECQDEASVDEDPLDKNLYVLLPHLYYTVISTMSGGHDPQSGYKQTTE